MANANESLLFCSFRTWADVLTHIRAGLPIYYHAPLDFRPRRVTIARVYKNGKVRIDKPSADADGFTADASHLDRFRYLGCDRPAVDLAKGQELARQATRGAEFRGHRLGAWLWNQYPNRRCGRALCLDCGREAHVNTNPLPNDIDVSGEAVALGCTKGSTRAN